MMRGVFPAIAMAAWCVPGVALAGGLKTVVLPTAGDKLAVKLADQVEFNLEDNEDIALEGRDPLLDALDKQDPFGERTLQGAMDSAGTQVLVRVVKQKGTTYGIIMYDASGLDVDQFEAGSLKAAPDAKAVGAKVAAKVSKSVATWAQKRKARAAKRDEEHRAEAHAAEKKQEQRRTVWAADDDDVPPPPDSEPAPKPAKGRALPDDDAQFFVDEEALSKPAKKETPRAAPTPPPAKPAKREPERKEPAREKSGGKRAILEEPQDDEARADADDPFADRPAPKPRPRPAQNPKYDSPRKGAVDEAEKEGKDEPFTPERFVKSLYTLQEPSPYFVGSAGPEVLAWSYALSDKSGKRRASTCAPTTTPAFAFTCTPHVGGNLWLEAWPIRYLGLDSSARVAFTRYAAAVSASTGKPVTDQDAMMSVLFAGHVAAKARFVFNFGPLPGAGAGLRLRLGYSRNLVQKQTPFIAVPGYHAATLGGGVEGYLPLLWKMLSFDARAEFIPLVFYQEIGGIALDPGELVFPKGTLNNPGASARTVGWRIDAGVRGVALGGVLLELRAFHEGYYAVFDGIGNRTDVNLNRIAYGRSLNLTFGLTLAVGWLFPKGLKPLQGDW